MKNLLFLFLLVYPLLLAAQEEAITFMSEGWTLNGTLSVPEGEGPFPVVILVHGSGANDRDQTAPLTGGNAACIYPQLLGETLKPFRDIANHLSANGIAVLRYDKRTFTHGASLDPITTSTYDFADDVANAVDFVKTQSSVDTSCIVLAGHSQGSVLIPIAALNRPSVAGLISLAGAVTPIDSLLPEQYRQLYIQCANDPITGANVANQIYDLFEQLRAGNFEDDEVLQFNAPGVPQPISLGYPIFWRDWINMNDSVLINYEQSGLPTLVLHGTNDFNVPVSDAQRFANGLPTSQVSVQTYLGVNHFLTPANEPTVDEALLNTMVDWIKNIKTINRSFQQEWQEQVQMTMTKEGLTLDFASTFPFEQLRLYDMVGRLLLIKPLNKDRREQTIALPELPTVVVASLLAKDGVLSRKLYTAP